MLSISSFARCRSLDICGTFNPTTLTRVASRLENGTAVEVDANRLLVNGSLIYCIYVCISLSSYTGTMTTHTHQTYNTVQALGAGDILASSEWIYWETSLIIGRFRTVPLSVHTTISTQVISIDLPLVAKCFAVLLCNHWHSVDIILSTKALQLGNVFLKMFTTKWYAMVCWP